MFATIISVSDRGLGVSQGGSEESGDREPPSETGPGKLARPTPKMKSGSFAEVCTAEGGVAVLISL